MSNDFGSLYMDMPTDSTFEKALKSSKATFQMLKKSLQPFAVLYTTKILVQLPFGLPKFFMTDSTNKFSLIYTNLNASKESYSFDGKRDVGNYFLVPGYGTICAGVSLCTIGQRMSLAVYCDQVSMKTPQDLCDIF